MRILWKISALTVLFGWSAAFCGGAQQVPAEQVTPRLVKRIEPQYPQMAAIAHVQGDVIIDITITDTGGVTNVRVISGHPLLIQAALDAVRQWKYSPFLTDGKPGAVETVVRVGFYLGASPEQVKKYEQIAQQFDAVRERCHQELSDQQLDQAEATCKQAMAISARLDRHRHLERADAAALTGHALSLQKKFAEALENYQKELKYTLAEESEGAELAAAHYHVGNGLWGTGRLDEAATEYEKAEALYVAATGQIDSEFLKNEYAKGIKTVLADHASLLRRMGKSSAADALDQRSAAITVKTGVKE